MGASTGAIFVQPFSETTAAAAFRRCCASHSAQSQDSDPHEDDPTTDLEREANRASDSVVARLLSEWPRRQAARDAAGGDVKAEPILIQEDAEKEKMGQLVDVKLEEIIDGLEKVKVDIGAAHPFEDEAAMAHVPEPCGRRCKVTMDMAMQKHV